MIYSFIRPRILLYPFSRSEDGEQADSSAISQSEAAARERAGGGKHAFHWVSASIAGRAYLRNTQSMTCESDRGIGRFKYRQLFPRTSVRLDSVADGGRNDAGLTFPSRRPRGQG
ncbi:hypothetical protein CEXT_320851 [Caerostris extrusa]|uniref:Uncharacterized protein n=1 Tax=Caerostris extrusa TaxID=172846 RepID=A0AAV4VYQ2_CAEEX|nr:hypothetical protein CEXT_320851 [Caerostris extrusa]